MIARCYDCRACLDDREPDRDGVITCGCGARNATTIAQRRRMAEGRQLRLGIEPSGATT